jgi:hypothetical protein
MWLALALHAPFWRVSGTIMGTAWTMVGLPTNAPRISRFNTVGPALADAFAIALKNALQMI